MASMTQSSMSLTANLTSKPTASDLLRSSHNGVGGIPLKSLGKAKVGAKRRDFTITARRRRNYDYPWGKDPHNLDPDIQGGIFRHLSPFKPLTEKPKPVVFDFEKPIIELRNRIAEVHKQMDETGEDLTLKMVILELEYQKALKQLSASLTPYQRVKIARHPHRPTFLDHVFNMTDSFIELHGDRAGYDDPAIVTGLGSINGKSYMFIGHQKGRNAKENIMRNFGMPTPHGYRKALRMMHYADHHGFPIVTFIDTPGAYADLKSEELNQGEAIAQNLRSMFGLRVPVISIVIGEGGSGGALAIGCANKLFMLENAVFYVASPEACAAILYKTSAAADKAAKKLKITATELRKLGVCDDIIPEPASGAHNDPYETSLRIKSAIVETMNELSAMDLDTLLKHRSKKFRSIGAIDPKEINRKRIMRKKAKGKLEVAESEISESELMDEFKTLKQEIMEASKASEPLPEDKMNAMIQKLQKMIDFEYAEAAKYVGSHDKMMRLIKSLERAKKSKSSKVALFLKKSLIELREDFIKKLPLAPGYSSLKTKIYMKTELMNLPKKLKLSKTYSEFMDRPDVKERFEAIKAEAAELGVKNPESHPELKKKLLKVKKQVQQEFNEVLKSMGLELVPIHDPNPRPVPNPSGAKSNKGIPPYPGQYNGSLVKETKKIPGLKFSLKDVISRFF